MSTTTVTLCSKSDFAGWRAWTRKLLNERISPENIEWRIEQPIDLYHPRAARILPESPSALSISRAQAQALMTVLSSSHPDRFSACYHFMSDIHNGTNNPELLSLLKNLSQQTRNEALDLRSSFPSATRPGVALLFTDAPSPLIDSQVRAFQSLRARPWAVVSPHRTLRCTGSSVFFGPGISDDLNHSAEEDIVRRLETETIAGPENEWWQNLAVLSVTPDLRALHAVPSLDRLRAHAVDCMACELCRPASRTVTGEGDDSSPVLFVGEQPGDQEDHQGRPFVGPAGQLFDKALDEAGARRERIWLTNAVKHFRFEPRNGRRIHKKPELQHIKACNPWLEAERRVLSPRVTVLMGATAAQAVLGRPVRIMQERSRFMDMEDGSKALITVHPSYLLRIPDEASKIQEYGKFVKDLKMAFSALAL